MTNFYTRDQLTQRAADMSRGNAAGTTPLTVLARMEPGPQRRERHTSELCGKTQHAAVAILDTYTQPTRGQARGQVGSAGRYCPSPATSPSSPSL